ncbi:Serine hydrolase family protein [Tenacibaculum sp. 190524A02b]|uniref:Serine hydrolase family protein n=1 Tax=Tenacibaculum vairaonense TaxID=3137860 RepID=A0ABP1FHW2_9FLAO
MTKYYIIPGYGNSDKEHWQTYFESKLENSKRIVQDNWIKPVLEDWVDRIEKTLSNENLSDIILIAHSLGGIALTHWVKKYDKKIKGALIVAPADIENPFEDRALESFTPIPKINLPFPSILVCSTNDNWMNLERAKLFASSWGSELIILKDAGHVSSNDGFGSWENGLKILRKLG